MTENLKQISISKNGVPVASYGEKQLIKITGILTSQIQLRGETTKEPYHYAFVKLKNQSTDLPVIFKLKSLADKIIEPQLKKGDAVELTGNYSSSLQNVRKSFTCLDYQILNKKIKKECSGCGDKFTCSSQENYNYCSKCELNGSRYLSKANKCPECDGSGRIKFKNQPPLSCKTCHLAKISILNQAKSQLPKLEAEAEKITQIRQQLENHD